MRAVEQATGAGAAVIRHEIDRAAIRRLSAPGGPIERDLRRRGLKVQSVARVLTKKDTGRLAQSIQVRIIYRRGKPVAMIGSDLYYAAWVHRGTGIYGPAGTPIVPRRAPYLKFFWKKRGHWVTARSVRGQPGAHYLTKALGAMRD